MISIKKYIFSAFLFLIFGLNCISQNEGKTISGKITDESSGLPLNGIKISVSDLTSTYSDEEGHFTINIVNNKGTIVISGKGYQTKYLPLKGLQDIDVKMQKEPVNSFYDNVIMPYDEKPLSYTINALSNIENSKIETNISPEDALKGKITGLNIISRAGTLGIGSNMFLRGYNSILSTNQPLIIVDGMIYDNSNYAASLIQGNINNPLFNIDIKDIESFTVIKDANSVYGSKAANGVILINTIHAKEEATHIDFYTHAGIKFKPVNIPVMEANDYRNYLTGQLAGSGLNPDQINQLTYFNDDINSSEYYRYHNNTNWQDQVFQDGYEQNYYLRVRGGDQIAKYGLSVGFLKSSGIVKETDLSRYSTRFNADVTITQKFKIKTNLSFTYGEKNLRDDGISYRTSPIYLSLTKAPIFYPYYINAKGEVNPTIEDYDLLKISNPVALIKNMLGNVQNYRFFGSAGVGYELYKNFKINTLIGITVDKNRENIFIPQLGVVPPMINNEAKIYNSATSILSRFFSIYSDTYLSYLKSFHHAHNVSAFAGIRYNINDVESDYGLAYNTPNDAVRDLGSGDDLLRRTGGYLGNWKWLSYYANIDYNYLNKYFISGNISLDGSSKVGNKADGIDLYGHKFGLFPSIGAAWLISSENFMQNFKNIDILKLRITYGLNGNDDIGFYNYQKYYDSQRFMDVIGTIRNNIPNPYIQWVTNKKFNIGFDLAVFNERLNISADIFNNNINKLLTIYDLPTFTGIENILSNQGSMTNNGYEINVNSRIINTDIKWNINAGIAHYKNKITSLPADNIITFGDATLISKVGNPVAQFYGYKTDGVFASDEEAVNSGLKNRLSTGELVNFRGGDVKFIDYHKDGIIDAADMQIIGDPNPKYTGIFGSTLSWKMITLEACFSFTQGNKVYNMLRHKLESMTGFENQTIAVVNRWKSEGQNTTIPRAEYGDPMGNSRFSDRWIEDGSYIRLSNITLSYNIPVKGKFFRDALIFISANNLFTISKYLGYDPEFSYNESATLQGIDYGLTPNYKSAFIGLKFGL
jgi:TonB-linked SusC/RagA family outer membrane protein